MAIRVHARVAKELGNLVLVLWTYPWLRGKGGYFVEREGHREQLPPAMGLVELADFSHDFFGRMEELRRVNKDTHFKGLIQLAKATLQPVEASRFYRADTLLSLIHI